MPRRLSIRFLKKMWEHAEKMIDLEGDPLKKRRRQGEEGPMGRKGHFTSISGDRERGYTRVGKWDARPLAL